MVGDTICDCNPDVGGKVPRPGLIEIEVSPSTSHSSFEVRPTSMLYGFAVKLVISGITVIVTEAVIE
jgi:hypothetical protein